MAVLKELAYSRKRTGTSNERQFIIWNVADEVEALSFLLASVPQSMNGLLLDTQASEVEEFEQGLDYYVGTAKYQNQTSSVSGPFSYSFNIGTQTIVLRHSYSTRHTYTASGASKRDFKGAINVDREGNVNGVEISVPVVQVEYGITVPASVVTQAYVNGLGSMVGACNSGPYLGNDTGEMLLTSVSGAPKDQTSFDIRFGFGVIKNTTGFQIDEISNIEKYGWEYVWAYYGDKPDQLDDGTKIIRSKATNVFVEQVYRLVSFSGLGL